MQGARGGVTLRDVVQYSVALILVSTVFLGINRHVGNPSVFNSQLSGEYPCKELGGAVTVTVIVRDVVQYSVALILVSTVFLGMDRHVGNLSVFNAQLSGEYPCKRLGGRGSSRCHCHCPGCRSIVYHHQYCCPCSYKIHMQIRYDGMIISEISLLHVYIY